MAKVLFLAPYSELCQVADTLEADYSYFSLVGSVFVPQDQVEEQLRLVEDGGCDLVIARGYYAQIVRKKSRLPLVELKTSLQELGMLVKSISAHKEKIALVAPAHHHFRKDYSLHHEKSRL